MMPRTRHSRVRNGAALLLVLFVSFAILLASAGIALMAMPRAKTVRTEAAGDRSLAIADATVDELVNQINKASLTTSQWVSWTQGGVVTEPSAETVTNAQQTTASAVVQSLLAQLNGGDAGGSGRYLLFTKTGEWFRLDSGTLAGGSLYRLGDAEGYLASTTGIPGLGGSGDTDYSEYVTNNLWFEADCHVEYWYDLSGLSSEDNTRPDLWKVHVTAFNLSQPDLKKNVLAEVSRGEVTGALASQQHTSTSSTTKLIENWFEVKHDTTETQSYFSDYAGLYGTSVSFGQYEVTTGPLRSDGNLSMKGWAQDVVYASGRVDDGNRYATGGGSYGSGRFGPATAKNLALKISAAATSTPKYVYDGTSTVPAAIWDNGEVALFGKVQPSHAELIRNPLDPNGGIQDKAVDTGTTQTYYIDATNAEVQFDVTVSGVGIMRWRPITAFNSNGDGGIKSAGAWTAWYPVPDTRSGTGNGAIFVTGNAYVSGHFTGRATLGAGNSVYLQSDITYAIAPRNDPKAPVPATPPDALGLIALNNVAISPYTYVHEPLLEIDATMMAVNGWFGLDPNILNRYPDYNTHNMPEADWNGSQAINRSNSTAPLVGSKGYAIQYTNFDNNLLDYGPAPYFPPTGTKVGIKDNLYLITSGLADTLRNLDKSYKHDLLTSDPYYALAVLRGCVKYVDYGGVRYYCTQEQQVTVTSSTSTEFTYTSDIASTNMYRVSWKEQVGDVVAP